MSESSQTKAELLARITAGWDTLQARVATLNEAELTARPAPDEWSIKDHVAHLMAYEQGIAALLRREPRWEAMQLSTKFAHNAQSFDEINAVLHAQYQDQSAAEVLAASRTIHQQLLDAVAGLTDDDLRRPYATYQPHDPDANGHDPVIGWIIGDTYDHYAEHLPWMEELLRRQTT